VKKKVIFGAIALALVVALVVPLVTACPAPPAAKDKIVIGAARPLSGPLQAIGDYAFGPVMNLWVEEVNADGGLYVKDYGKNLPIELKVYDDTSDLGTSSRLIEKLILEDKVDFLFPNCSTAFLYASAPLANKYGYVYLGAEGGCTTLTDMLPELPYVFAILNYSDHYQIPVLCEIFDELGVKTAAIVYINDLHGVEYYHTSLSEFLVHDIQILMAEAVPPFAADIELQLKAARDTGADALCSYTYPPTSLSTVGQSIGLGYNPKAMVIGPGACFQFFYDAFGPMTEGIMGFGAWNAKSSPAAKEFADKFIARWGIGQSDWWGAIHYYAGVQCLQQAIEKAGTLDQAKIRDVMATEHFTTVLGDTWFDMSAGGAGGGILAVPCYLGQIGQWQSGTFEVIDTGAKRTAPPIYPKPAWPAPPE